MGGAGKTTLLQHLGQWWQGTGLVEQVFYFGYDERGWTRQQLMVAVAERLLGKAGYWGDYGPLPREEAQQELRRQRLRSQGHLLMLDNLESIAGAHLAIQNTLPAEERAKLHSFLKALRGGRSLVLLGSRSGEEWLAAGTFEANLHDLGGLDPEAASTLAERI